MNIEETIIRLAVATFLGGIIGIEREYRNKSAGFRTMILIALGSALFTVLSINLAADFSGTDVSRIVSYVVGGIGFLGAGAIIKEGLSVRGLTTASTIWLVAAVGIGAGGGYFAESIFATVLSLSCLILLPYLEIFIGRHSEYRNYQITAKTLATIDEITAKIHQEKIAIIKSDRSKSTKGPVLWVAAHGNPTAHKRLADWMIDNDKIVEFS